ncbi:MAG: WYL domain-containing protein [Actinobacteria bacterium]|nr:MAG: WYL domain-containing protein [Actinomycetota bacterium]
MADRLERLLNLTATLLDTRRPLTLDELAERLEPPYPADKTARRRQFERDKETLRELGVPITVEPVDALGNEVGYRIYPEDYYLGDPGLNAKERAALHVAVTAVRLAGDDAREGLRKLGGREGRGAEPFAEVELEPALPPLVEAVSRRSTVTFSYRGEQRSLEPYGVVLRWGHWYVVGRDRDREAPRAFRLDRFDAPPVLGAPGEFTPPSDVDPAQFLRDDPLTYGEDEPIVACVLVDASRAGWVVEQLGDDAVVERRDDGAVVVRLDVVNRDAFRGWVIDLLEHAEILEPVELRDDLVAWLSALVEGART